MQSPSREKILFKEVFAIAHFIKNNPQNEDFQ